MLSFPISPALQRVIDAISKAQGQAIAVGGCVRDHLLGLPPKDIDLEIYGLPANLLEALLGKLGSVHAVGKNFGVLKLTLDNESFDIALPRTENKTGQGHRGFLVSPDPELTFEEAASRRDFTINSMGIELPQMHLLDPFNGQKDLSAKILRHVSLAFSEDPLRVFRACQFAARFDFKLATETLALCQSLQGELSTLAPERIAEEIRKLLLSPKPSIGLEYLLKTGALKQFPELESLIGCEQDPKWHPEGDVWVHTLMVVDQAAGICREAKLSEEERFVIILAALCHDLGKPATTQLEDGRVRSKAHDVAGEQPTRSLLQKFGVSGSITEEVVPLVIEHLRPMQLYKEHEKVSHAAIKRLSLRVSIEKLCLVATADFLGRTTPEALLGHDPSTAWLLNIAKQLQVHQNAPKPFLQGRDLLELGFKPGPKIGTILKKAFEAQLDDQIANLQEAIQWVRENYGSKIKS